MKSLFSLLLVLISSTALAAGGDPNHIPVSTIIFQAINVGCFVAIVTYFVAPKIKAHFTSRQDDFTAAARKAAELKESAEKHKLEIETKMKELESSAQSTIENAKKEAEALKTNLLKEADEMVAKIRSEAEKAGSNEVARATEELRRGLLEAAVEAARKSAAGGLDDSDQKRLQTEFVSKVQAVQP